MGQFDVLTKPSKVIKVSGTALTGDAMLADSSGLTVFDISDVAAEFAMLEVNVSTLAGTNVIVKVVTSNERNSVGVAAPVAKKANGSTDFSYTAITQGGIYQTSTGFKAADGSAASTLGKFVGIFVDAAGTLTAGDISATLYLRA
jgi:hypothetical protein